MFTTFYPIYTPLTSPFASPFFATRYPYSYYEYPDEEMEEESNDYYPVLNEMEYQPFYNRSPYRVQKPKMRKYRKPKKRPKSRERIIEIGTEPEAKITNSQFNESKSDQSVEKINEDENIEKINEDKNDEKINDENINEDQKEINLKDENEEKLQKEILEIAEFVKSHMDELEKLRQQKTGITINILRRHDELLMQKLLKLDSMPVKLPETRRMRREQIVAIQKAHEIVDELKKYVQE